MKITKKQLNEMVNKIVAKNLETILNEGSTDFTAKRNIIQQAQNASMEFEQEIVKALNLISPDEIDTHLQQKYFEVAQEMKQGIVRSVATAVRRFATLPRKNNLDVTRKPTK